MSEIPNNVWENLSMGFCGPFPNGYYVMVILDEYSRYPVIETLTSLTAKSVIPLLDQNFLNFWNTERTENRQQTTDRRLIQESSETVQITWVLSTAK